MRIGGGAAGAAAWALAAAAAAGLPARAAGGDLGDLAGRLSGGAADTLRGLGALAIVDAGVPAAAALLVLSLLYAGVYLLMRLSARGAPAPAPAPGPDAGRARVLVAAGAVAGHGAGLAALAAGAQAALFYAAGGAVAAALLLGVRRGEDGAERGAPAGAGRVLAIGALGLVVALLAASLDEALQALLRAPVLPEAWFAAAAAAGGGFAAPGPWAVLLATGAASFGLARASEPLAAEGAFRALGATAPAWILLLGPSHPVRGAAVALAVHALARAGVPPAGRAAFVLLLVAGLAALATFA